MLVDHFWKILFILVVGVGCWFWLKYEKGKKLYAGQIEEIAELVDTRGSAAAKDAEQAAERYQKTMALLNSIATKKGDKFAMREVFVAVGEVNESTKPETDALIETFDQSYNYAKSMGLFSPDVIDDTMFRMEDGSAAKIAKGPWKGENAVVGFYLPPAIAENLANHPANRVLLPHSVRIAADHGPITRTMDNRAERLKSSDILDIGTREKIRLNYDFQRKR